MKCIAVLIPAVLLFFAVFWLGFVVAPLSAPSKTDPSPRIGSIERCSVQMAAIVKPKEPDANNLEELLNYCYARSYYEAALGEAEIRREIYSNQPYQNSVMLWMVVIITVSGVMLSALQLLASYRLAVKGRESMTSTTELSIARDKLAIRSSITGLLILTVSLAFFFVYVVFVYTIRMDVGETQPGPSQGDSLSDTQTDAPDRPAPPVQRKRE
ncbi:hypothetical protein ACCT28_23050 [Rhizobium ruizarguesonis]